MGKRDPFEDLDPLVQRVYAYVAYRVGDRSLAEQITAEAFDRALRHRAAFDPRHDDPVAWLVGIARSLVDLRRREADPAGGSGLPAAVAQLDDRDGELIALRYGSDLDRRQIAALLDLSPNAVEEGVQRAVARLHQSFRSTAGPAAL